MGRVFRKEEISEYSRRILNLMDEQGINSRESFEERIGIYPMNDEERIIIELRPSNSGIVTHTISYIDHKNGIPIELRVNYELGYSTILLKTDHLSDGFELFGDDAFGNFMQYKKIEETDIPKIRKKLEKLVCNFE